MATRVYIDVDGVLNAIPARGTSAELLTTASNWSEYRSTRINGYVITWSPELIKILNDLSEQEDVEFVWVTTWRDLARTKISPGIGLNGQEWRFLTDGGEATGRLWGIPGRTWWKLTEVRDDLRADPVDKVIWIDDDLPLYGEALEWAAERGVFAIAPLLDTGLTRNDIEGVIEIVQRPLVSDDV